MTKSTVLVIAAHPDDEVLGCGATVARLAGEGHAVSVAILGEGATARSATRSQADPSGATALQGCAREAARLLGARDVRFFDLPDNRFDSLDLLDIVKLVESLLREIQPAVIFTHHPGDLNIDHALTFRAVLTAARPLPGCSVRELLAFEIASSTEWGFGRLGAAFSPDTFFDVSQTLDAKCRALACYPGEMQPFPHPRSEDALRATAKRWGSSVGMHAAEAFETIYVRK